MIDKVAILIPDANIVLQNRVLFTFRIFLMSV